MRWPTPLLFLMIAACASSSGPWPSLARRPVEAGATAPAPAAPMVAAPPAKAAADTSVAPVWIGPVSTDDIPARLNTIARDLDDAAARIKQQQATTETAATAATNAKADSAGWANAQLELTRFERSGSQIDGVQDRLSAIAGTLAVAAAGGSDVSALLKTTGTLIARTRAMTEAYKVAFAHASAAIAR